jgi:tRNA 2-thiouridine synthesizing protein A
MSAMSTPTIQADVTVDAKGQMCPMPVLTLAKAMRDLKPGQILAIMATDKGAKSDIPAWSERTGNPLLQMTEENGVLTFYVQKAA